jgi:hypothetical protein
MKLLIRDFVASLRERNELDAIIPDMVSALGLTVLTRPSIGTRQFGVDMAAVGRLDDAPETLYLFTIKMGNIGRGDWSNGEQSVRASLDEIRDVYISSHVPPEFAELPIQIVLCFGGELREAVLPNWSGYTAQHQTELLKFSMWNGDKVADMILTGVLGSELLPVAARRSFQKAVALTDEPEVSFEHFCKVLNLLRKMADDDDTQAPKITRTITIALWVLYVWARENDNIEAAYLAAERTFLTFWDMLKDDFGKKEKPDQVIAVALTQVLNLFSVIFENFYDAKVAAFVSVPQALAMALRTQNPIDVNLGMFELIGRLALHIIWQNWSLDKLIKDDVEVDEIAARRKRIDTLVTHLKEIVNNNQVLNLPVCDRQVTEIGLVLVALVYSGRHYDFIENWFSAMTMRLWMTGTRRSGFPTSKQAYREIVLSRNGRLTDEEFNASTKGSTIVPLVAAWMAAFGNKEASSRLAQVTEKRLAHTTMQTWLVGADSEANIYLDQNEHGVALTDLKITETGAELLEILRKASNDTKSDLDGLSATRTGFYPIILLACRHWHLPVPLQFWIGALGEDNPPLAQL